jgi:1-acyl-sn-glycerol-3-phosphate acyltransferase
MLPRVPLLYDGVALGMWAYSRSSFRVRTLGAEGLRLRPGTIIAATHRRESDVPLICPSVYFQAGLLKDRPHRMSFAAREDLFEPGFLAGFPPRLPTAVRRLLFGVNLEPGVRAVMVNPIRSASTVRLGEVVRTLPGVALEDVVPAEADAALRTRAAALGLPEPRRAGDVARGEYADLLWRAYERGELDGPALEPVWARRARAAAEDFRALVELLRGGGVLLVFPEGRPSPNGDVGPLRRGIDALVRRGRPRWILPVGVAYDPLTAGRTRAFVSFGATTPAPAEDVEGAILGLLRRAVPLTAGQTVAADVDLGEAVEVARAEGRPVDPELLDPARRQRRLAEARAAAAGREGELAFLAREYASVRT